MYNLKVEQNKIDEILNDCAEAHESGSNFHGMTYEQGVEAAILWVTGQIKCHPLNE